MNWRNNLIKESDTIGLDPSSASAFTEGEWHALVNNYVSYREGQLRMVFAYRDEATLDRRILSMRDKAERILQRTDFDQEFTKVKITVERIG